VRSREEYIIAKDAVHGYADNWLSTALRLEHHGYRHRYYFRYS